MHGNILTAHLRLPVLLMQAKTDKVMQHLFLHAIQYFLKPQIVADLLLCFVSCKKFIPLSICANT